MGSAEHWMAWPLACLSESSSVAESACWWALEFSPRVALLEDALLMETSMVQRLWGGTEVLLARLDSAFAQACQAAVPGLPESGGGDAALQPLRGHCSRVGLAAPSLFPCPCLSHRCMPMRFRYGR